MNIWPLFENSTYTILFFVFCFIACVQLLYTIFIHFRLMIFKNNKNVLSSEELPPLSVIIAARNEADNLYNFLPMVLEQDYPEFEVIVVNHQSIDESYHILQAYQIQFPNLKVIELNKNHHLKVGKKLPISLAIKAAKYEHLVFTDADCKPNSHQWLKKMARNFNQKQIVIGYGPYHTKKGFLNKIIRLDTVMIAINYLSFALAKIPYMAVGRNMAYTKSSYNAVNGFKSHYGISSGDDDLFIQQAAKNKNYTIEIDSSTHCYSEPKSTWEEWLNQKSRHYTTSDVYSPFKKILLGIYPLTVILLWFFTVILLFNTEYRFLTLIVFLSITLLKWIVNGVNLHKLKSSSFIYLYPILDLFYAILMPFIYYNSDRNQFARWK